MERCNQPSWYEADGQRLCFEHRPMRNEAGNPVIPLPNYVGPCDHVMEPLTQAETREAALERVGGYLRSVLRPIYDYADLTESRRKEIRDAMEAWDALHR